MSSDSEKDEEFLEENLEEAVDWPECSVITIVLEPDMAPRVDLGEIHPTAAASLFRRILETLDDFVMYPQVSYQGDVIVDPNLLWGDAFSEDEDD